MSGRSFIRVFFPQGGLLLRWSFIRMVVCQGGLTSGWSLIKVVFVVLLRENFKNP